MTEAEYRVTIKRNGSGYVAVVRLDEKLLDCFTGQSRDEALERAKVWVERDKIARAETPDEEVVLL